MVGQRLLGIRRRLEGIHYGMALLLVHRRFGMDIELSIQDT